RLHAHLSDAEEALVELRVVDTAPQLTELDGEVRVLHLPGHRLLEAPLEAARRVDVQLGPGQERGDEERDALDVVPMRVADEEVESHRLGHRPNEGEAGPTAASAAVEDDPRTLKEDAMRTTRRSLLRLMGAGAAAATVRRDAAPVFAQAGGPVKIGVLTIRAGIAAPVGAAGLRSTEWWLERVNKAGGILG